MAPKIDTHVYTVSVTKVSHKDGFIEIEPSKVFLEKGEAKGEFLSALTLGEITEAYDGESTQWRTIDGGYFKYQVRYDEHPILIDTEDYPIPLTYDWGRSYTKDEEGESEWQPYYSH